MELLVFDFEIVNFWFFRKFGYDFRVGGREGIMLILSNGKFYR